MQYEGPFLFRDKKILTVGGIFAIIAAIGIFFFQRSHLKSMEYRGKVVDKYVEYSRYRAKRGYYRRGSRKYILVVQTNEGKRVRHPVSFRVYNEILVGDSVIKKKGNLYPEKIFNAVDSIEEEYRDNY